MLDLWQEIYGTMKRNKLRTALTGFAVAWGIFMLIVLLGAGNGLIHAFEQSSSERALNVIRVYPGWTQLPYDGLKEGRFVELDNRDLTETERLFPDEVIETGGQVNQGGITISYGAEYISNTLIGVSPAHIKIEAVKLISGRFVNEIDINERRKVIVLHKNSAETLFKQLHTDPVGQFINVGAFSFQVVGIYGDMGDQGQRGAYVPFSTLQTIYNKGNKLNYLLFTTRGLNDEESNLDFEGRYRRVLAGIHRFDPDDTGAVWIGNRMRQYIQSQKAMGILTTAIWVIGIFTLLSGIVGVSNIMLITVKERTHEFGIRKALGAKPRSILWLVISESIVITTLFGYIGMVAGIGITELMDSYFGAQTMDAGMFQQTMFTDPTVDLHIALQATVTLIVAGTLAGFFPARKATHIRPIEALNAI
ncbi:MAG: ABC transporter permease [Bacteroides sp.]